MRIAKLLLTSCVLLLASAGAIAHEGGLDANGCHYDRAHGNKYHCHKDVLPNPDRTAPVKKSRENICHGRQSPNYRTLKYFVSFRTMAACVTSGGEEQMSTSGGLSGH